MPEPYYTDERVTLFLGDCLDVMATLEAESVDAVCTDPPYGLEFMGKEWDGSDGFRRSLNPADTARDSVFGRSSRTSPEYRAGELFQRWSEQWATECLRILKPGGHLLAFGGSRTWHRLAAAIEDAGFEIRDSIAWIYGSGFPKSLDVSKAIDRAAGADREVVGKSARHGGGIVGNGSSYELPPEVPDVTAPATQAARDWSGWGTALKPAFEPVVVARKPLGGTVAANVQAHGCGALNIDGCRVGSGEESRGPRSADEASSAKRYTHSGAVNLAATPGPRGGSPAGRWPANVVLDDAAAAELDRQSGTLTSGANPTRRSSDKFRNAYGDFTGQTECVAHRGADSGGASRFFPTFRYTAKAATAERPTADGVAHPTVKPLDLMRWLVRLVTPPGGTVLEPFAGSGTTVEACIHEHKKCIAIEREPSYLPLIRARLSKPMQVGFDFEAGA